MMPLCLRADNSGTAFISPLRRASIMKTRLTVADTPAHSQALAASHQSNSVCSRARRWGSQRRTERLPGGRFAYPSFIMSAHDDYAVFIHPAALVESDQIGAGSRIWAFAHVMGGVTIGRGCNVGDHSFVESRVTIGNDAVIKNGVSIWDGVIIEDRV